MTRYPDWETRLAEVFEQAKNKPFQWGSHDCALFACNAIQAMTGVDMAEPLRGTYDSAATAARAIREFIGRDEATVEDVAVKQCLAHGAEEVRPTLARRGDVVTVDSPTGPALGMVSLDGASVLAVSPKGLVRFSLSSARRAWRVG